jgi:hypothetical protein
MGIINYIKRLFRLRPAIQQLPMGSLTVDHDGLIVTSTVSSAYSKELLGEIGNEVLALFREARAGQMPLTEINIHYGSFLLTARELRGGAVIFLLPHSALSQMPT